MSEGGASFVARLRAAREKGDVSGLVAAVPYAAFLGIGVELADGQLRGVLRYSDTVIGNPTIPALHGGAIATLLETTAVACVLWEEAPPVLPRPVTLTFDFLRSGRPIDTWASAKIIRRGRRICTVRVSAWQVDADRPIAAAGATLLLG